MSAVTVKRAAMAACRAIQAVALHAVVGKAVKAVAAQGKANG